ncbi:MAG: hypothetical protein K2H53_06140, partial [Clostridia bacterium]|nr:hypothetical protein [Clostridia bacterium]
LHSIFGVEQIPKEMKEKIKDEEFLSEFRLKEKNLERLKVKVDRKIDLISKTNAIFDEKYVIKAPRIQDMLEEMQRHYDLILIDTSSDTQYKELTKTLISLSSKVICLIEGNIIHIRKTGRILKENMEQRHKIKLIYNKKNQYTLSSKIMKVLFLRFKIIGTLEYNNKYNKIINKSVKRLYIGKSIRKEFKKIIEKL